ncbi:MAG: DUF1284 domain-containing protein, partial [Puniceicoccales bacterium]|nr:DUF1284 domain-containing protein [Puniceicoccales bacterium]
MEIFPLRPHHAVCLLGFRGKGYDEKFVEEMGKVWRSLKEGKGQVRLVEGCDVLCKHCPQR